MNILLIANHYAVASGRYCYDALKRLGHDVHTVGAEMGTHIWGIEVDAQYVWQPDPPPDDWSADLVLVMDSAVEVGAKSGGAPVVVYGVDNHVSDYGLVSGASHYFLAHGHGARIGDANVTWLPCGYDPVWFTPGQPYAERPREAALLGVIYPQRAELLYALLQGVPGVQVVYGTGLYDQYRECYQGARLSLVRSAHHDVAQRVWETAAMGCLVVMDDCPDCAPLGLVDGVNCLIYRTTGEAVEKVRWAQAHLDEAAAVAAAGQAWAAPGTWDARCQVIIEWVKAQGGTTARKSKA